MTASSRKARHASALAVSLVCSQGFAAVTILQTEAYPSAASTDYAPVLGLSTSTSVTIGGITYTRLGAATGQSGHAATVAQRAYSLPGSPGYGVVSNVYSEDAGTYLNYSLYYKNGSSIGAPSYFGRNTSDLSTAYTTLGINVVTDAWVGDSNSTVPVRRSDFQIAREHQVVVVNGAATPLGSPATDQRLMWSSYNSIAVRGTQTFTLPTTPTGKLHADLWLNDAASYATGTVAGDAAALISTAQGNLTLTDAAQNGVVIRSLLMTGANKSASFGATSWTRDTTNNLSVQLGAGTPSLAKSTAILAAGEKTTYAVTGNSIASAIASPSSQGWAFSTNSFSDRAVTFQAVGGITAITATLNWNFTSKEGQALDGTTLVPTIDTSDAGRIYADLNLDLVSLTPDGHGGFTLGTPLAQTGLQSHFLNGASGNDNIEHLYWTTSGSPLSAGYYAFVVRDDNSNIAFQNTPFALSYDLTVVPEPATLAACLAGGLLLGYRRRRACTAEEQSDCIRRIR